MPKRTLLVVGAAVLTLLFARPAGAGHHLWRFTQAYSNASGTVQYVMLQCPVSDPFENFLGGNSVTDNGSVPLSDVSGSTAGKYVLLATGTIAGVAPDFPMPAGFLSTGGGAVNYALGTDVWGYGALPTDGSTMLLRNGTTAPATLTNFQGTSAALPSPPAAPALPRWGLALGVGVLLLAGSGLLRARRATAAH
jgi:hypothetical protein